MDIIEIPGESYYDATTLKIKVRKVGEKDDNESF